MDFKKFYAKRLKKVHVTEFLCKAIKKGALFSISMLSD